MKNNKKLLSLFLFIFVAFFAFVNISCAQTVNTIKDIYSSENTKKVNVQAKAIYKGSEYAILGKDDDLFAINKVDDIEVGSSYEIQGTANIIDEVFIVSPEKVTKISDDIVCAPKAYEMGKSLKDTYLDKYYEVKKITMVGVLSWMGEIRGIYREKIGAYLYTTDAMREFELFSGSGSTFKIGDTVLVEAYVIGVNTNEGCGFNVLFSEVRATDPEINNPSTDTFDLHILELNDTHGYITRDETGKNGLANVSYLINEIRNQNPKDDTILIANGDMFQGTAISNLTHGLSVINAMNVMNFDCMVLGNHEFDWQLKEILQYFDNNPNNGEANFPLLNANVYNNDGTLVTVDNGNVYSSTIIEKEGIKVGIIGCIGDVYSSINYAQSKDYYFETNITQVVKTIGTELKTQGANVIVVSIHGGNSSGIENYGLNMSLSEIKVNGEYLVDAIINGHTHSRQTGYMTRANGVRVPLVQGGCNAEALGEIVLSIDTNSKKVVSATSKVTRTYTAGASFDQKVQEVIDNEEMKIKDQLTEVYAVAGESVDYASSLQTWVGKVLLEVTKADFAICNAGGLRSNGNIVKGENITIENMYMINPFDNYIMIVPVQGYLLERFLNNSSIFYAVNPNVNFDSSKTYNVAVIDYVYYYDSFPRNDDAVNTNIIMRDALIEDVKKHDVFYPVTRP